MSLYAPTPTWHQQPAYEPHSLSAPSSPYLAASRRSPSPALSEVIDTAKKATSQLEDRFDAIARPLRPYFPAIARSVHSPVRPPVGWPPRRLAP